MAEYLRVRLLQEESANYLEKFVAQMDLDKDGFINSSDLEWFVKNARYLDQVSSFTDSQNNPMSSVRFLPLKNYGQLKIDGIKSQNQTNVYQFTSLMNQAGKEDTSCLFDKQPSLFPIIPLSDEKVNQVLRDLRKNLDANRITYKIFFELMDSEKNGLISASQFSDNLDKYVALSQPVKDGFFAYIDKQHIGMIDYDSLMNVLQKSVKEVVTQEFTEDNWSWQNMMLKQITDWYLSRNFESETEAFRVLDLNYKGYSNLLFSIKYINQFINFKVIISDLRKFLLDIIKVKERDLSYARVNRLFKILDFYKCGRISSLDFTNFLGQQMTLKKIKSKKTVDHSVDCILEWKYSAQQQLGLILSRNFSSPSDGFQCKFILNTVTKENYLQIFIEISEKKSKITFDAFEKWVEQSNALGGFDLTKMLMHQLFAFFDPHKKGFLTETDWNMAFSHINWRKQAKEEIKDFINLHFGRGIQIRAGFDFFANKSEQNTSDSLIHQKVIYFEGFNAGVAYLQPGRFTTKELKEIWLKEIHSQNNERDQGGMSYTNYLEFVEKIDFGKLSTSLDKQRDQRDPNKYSERNLSQQKYKDTSDYSRLQLNNGSQSDRKNYNSSRSFCPNEVTGKKAIKQRDSEDNSNQNLNFGGKYLNPILRNEKLHWQKNSKILSDLDNQLGIQNYNEFKGNKLDPISSSTNLNQPLRENNHKNDPLRDYVKRSDSSFNREQDIKERSFQGIISKVKKILRTSVGFRGVENLLRKEDESNSGFLTNLQLKKVLTELKLRLDTIDMDIMLSICDKHGKVLISTLKQLLLSERDEDILIDASASAKIKQIAKVMIQNKILPLDAFRKVRICFYCMNQNLIVLNLQDKQRMLKQTLQQYFFNFQVKYKLWQNK